MGTTTTPFIQQSPQFIFTKKILPCTIYVFYAIFPLVLFRLYFNPVHLPQSPQLHHITVSSPFSHSSSSFQEKAKPKETEQCDYSNGKWVLDKLGPLYNGSTCGTIKEGQNCMAHGRSDLDYLFWRWKPKKCNLPRFEPSTFLKHLMNKHLAFVGDSMARNQLESLLCMLSTFSPPKLVYSNGEDNKFRKWHFDSYNVTISVYWSPFLVEGVEKSSVEQNHNKLYLDRVNERWASDMKEFDMVVLSIGHWFLHPAVYLEGDLVIGCHYCPGLNHTEIGFYDVLRKALRTTLKTIIERRGTDNSHSGGIDVFVTTFSPSHFEGEWDKFGACSKTKPYKEEEKKLEGMDFEMRRIEIKEVAKAKENAKKFMGLRIANLDISGLSLLRADGHPGPYMHPFPFADGVKDRVQNDCVHWCLPGLVDTWNEILLEIVKKWRGESSR